MSDNEELRPREYAQRCAALDSRAARRAYLADVVPQHFNDWVRLYVEQWFKQTRKQQNQ